MSSTKSSVRLKLLVDKKNQKVLFAEAGKDFVDFLFTLLRLPIGTVIRLLSKNNGTVGTLGKLYNSVENLGDTYMQPNVSKDTLLKPKMPIGTGGAGATSALLSLPSCTSSSAKRFYVCGYTYCSLRYVSDDSNAVCPTCKTAMFEAPYVALPAVAATAAQTAGSSSGEEGGYVRGVVSYMVMDDLEVKPLSTISSISMLNQFNIKEVGRLEEKTVSLGINKGLKLLEASLRSSTVLTDVFMKKKASTKRRR